MVEDLVIIGASARAAAGSARRAGHRPWCVDLFADRDLQAFATVRRCAGHAYPDGILPLLVDAPRNAPLVYTGAVENHPTLLERIAVERPLIGCDAATVRCARDPNLWQTLEPIDGISFCHVGPAEHRTLRKPLAGCGGVGVRFDDRAGKGEYLQQYVEGRSLAAVFLDGRLLGVTEQIIGDATFGVGGFRYAGSIGPIVLTGGEQRALAELGRVLMARCGLRWVFGVDLIRDERGRLWPIEINPRYTASVEVLEQATGVRVFARDEAPAGSDDPTVGKAIAFARREVVTCDLYELFERDTLADVPPVGERIAAGRPICTLFAAGPDVMTVRECLRGLANRLYTRLER